MLDQIAISIVASRVVSFVVGRLGRGYRTYRGSCRRQMCGQKECGR
jgi:hypothetical protein